SSVLAGSRAGRAERTRACSRRSCPVDAGGATPQKLKSADPSQAVAGLHSPGGARQEIELLAWFAGRRDHEVAVADEETGASGRSPGERVERVQKEPASHSLALRRKSGDARRPFCGRTGQP